MASNSEWILTTLRRVISNVRVGSDRQELSEDDFSGIVLSLEQIYRELIVAETLNSLDQSEQVALDLIRVALGMSTELCRRKTIAINLQYLTQDLWGGQDLQYQESS